MPRRGGLAAIVAALIAAGCTSSGDAVDTGTSDAGDVTAAVTETGETTVDTTSDTDPPGSSPAVTAPDSSPDTTTPAGTEPASDGIRRVPDDYPSIQAAVDAAAEGDLVLIAPGVYREAVDVVTDDLTIRGLDRDGVVLDGEFDLDNGIRVLGANGVAIENLTTQNYTNNGLFWIQSTGYRASYVTTYRTGNYGIYVFDSVQGQIEFAHTVGSRDAGVYIGQCYPCDAVVTDVVSSHNGIGYSGTNSGGNLVIVHSDWHNNRVGLVPNSGTYELCYPQRDTTIVGNRVWDNNQPDTPAIDTALLTQGNGILVAGGIGNTIERNRVDDHVRTGIGLVPFLEETPNDDLPTEDEWTLSCADARELEIVVPDEPLLWDSYDNVVRDNVVTDSGEADLAVASAGGDVATFRNCFSGNTFATSAPFEIETLAPCEGEGRGDWAAGDLEVARWIAEQPALPPESDWRTAPLPELDAHDDLPDAATAPARPATDVPMTIDLDAIRTPELPEG